MQAKCIHCVVKYLLSSYRCRLRDCIGKMEKSHLHIRCVPHCLHVLILFLTVFLGLFDESKCPTLIFAFFFGGWWTWACVGSGSGGGGVSSQEWEYGLRFDLHDNPTLTATHHHHSFSAHFHDDPLHRSNILWSGPHLLPLPSFLFFASEIILLLCVAGVGGA